MAIAIIGTLKFRFWILYLPFQASFLSLLLICENESRKRKKKLIRTFVVFAVNIRLYIVIQRKVTGDLDIGAVHHSVKFLKEVGGHIHSSFLYLYKIAAEFWCHFQWTIITEKKPKTRTTF